MGGGTEDGITTGGFCIDTAHAHVDDSDSSPSSLGARKAENWFIEWAQVKVERLRRRRGKTREEDASLTHSILSSFLARSLLGAQRDANAGEEGRTGRQQARSDPPPPPATPFITSDPAAAEKSHNSPSHSEKDAPGPPLLGTRSCVILWEASRELSLPPNSATLSAVQGSNPRTGPFAAAPKWHHFPLFIFCLMRLFRVREALSTSLIELHCTFLSGPPHAYHHHDHACPSPLRCHSRLPQHAMLAQNAARDE